jgi:transmembrane 9 superfamily protein 2/4
LAGVWPTLVICVEFWTILESISGPEYIYLVHWFAYICVFIFLVVVAEVAIILNYVTLCYEQYQWWWRVYLSAGSTGFWLFLIMLYYLIVDTQIANFFSLLTNIISAALICSMIGLMAASVAMIATLRFNLRIYARIKSE